MHNKRFIKIYSLFIIFTVFLVYRIAQADKFFFNFKEGQNFIVTSWTEEEIYKNDIYIKTSRSKTVGYLKIKNIENKNALHTGIYKDYIYDEASNSYILKQEYKTRFYRDFQGYYNIDRKYFMPMVRNVPVFPDKDLKIGEQWIEKAYEVHDFREAYGISNPVIFPAAASYQYLGTEKINGKNISKFSINYVINYTMKYNVNNSLVPLPYRIIGYFNQLFLWNKDKNLPDSYKENFDFILIMTNGDVLEYVGKSHGNVTVKEEQTEDKEIDKIKKTLKNIPDANVFRGKEGIIINIGEILFKFDSDEFASNANSSLNNIVEVLKDYPDRRIRIIGHTDSTGPENYNLNLSLKRAKRVAEELIKRLPELKSRITYIGMGEKMPIAPNDTEEGRKLNRRVEIIIMNSTDNKAK